MKKLALALFVATVFSSSAFAAGQDASITLQVNTGSVMTSTGGDFVSAASGQAVAAGQSVMLNAGSSATLTYGNGCKMELTQPGTYSVPAECKAAGGKSSGGSSGMNAAVIAGAAALGAVAIDQGKNTDNDPLSTGVRHY